MRKAVSEYHPLGSKYLVHSLRQEPSDLGDAYSTASCGGICL